MPQPQFQLGPLRQLTNPKAYATAATADYGPRINAILRDMRASQTQNTQMLGEMKSGYDQLASDTTGARDQGNDFLTTLMAQRDQSNQGLLSWMPADVAGTVAKSSMAGGDYLRGLGTTENSYLNNIRSADSLSGLEAATRQNQHAEAAQHDLLGQVNDLRGQRSADYAKAYQQGVDVRHGQAGDLLDAKIKAALASQQLRGAGLANDTTALNLKNAKQMQPLDVAAKSAAIRAQKLNNQGTKWQIDHAVDPTTGQSYDWNKLKPADLLGIQKSLQGQIDDGSGKLRTDPLTAYNVMGNQMRSMSHGKWNPYNDVQVRNYRNGILQNYLPGWNKAHPNKQYVFVNGRLVSKSAAQAAPKGNNNHR